MLEDLKPPTNRRGICRIVQISEGLDEGDTKILYKALEEKEIWAARTLATELNKRGITIADTTITRHRNKACNCFRD